jgi:hypothetical protein
MCLRVPADALHGAFWPRMSQVIPILTTALVAVATLIALAGRLPGYAKLGGDLRPADAQAYRMVDQHREFRFCRIPRDLGTLNLLQDLGRRELGSLRWQIRRFTWLRAAASGLSMPDLRLAPGLAHVVQHAASGTLEVTSPLAGSVRRAFLVPQRREGGGEPVGPGRLRLYGHSRSPSSRRSVFASGGCRPHSGSRASKRCRRCRAERRGHWQYQDRRSGVERGTRAPPTGLIPHVRSRGASA